ncbi:hypothetical protein AB447_203860 [Bacillus glycinifermentans]|nr:hypothetical protein AB447_203860 [Bacillus glycinifermentans]
MLPIKNRIEISKAEGGIWTSTYHKENGSDWIQVYDLIKGIPEEGLDGWLLIPSMDARVYTVSTLADLLWLHEKYEQKNAGVPDFIKSLDFEKMTDDFDAIHLTKEGQQQTRHSRPVNLWGWDSESTHWFRWCFEKVEYIGKVRGF